MSPCLLALGSLFFFREHLRFLISKLGRLFPNLAHWLSRFVVNKLAFSDFYSKVPSQIYLCILSFFSKFKKGQTFLVSKSRLRVFDFAK